LALQHAAIADEVRGGWDEVMASGAFVLGQPVRDFEEAFATYCGVSDVVGVANGTDAVELALRAVGVGRGDEVIVPANTFIATALAAHRAGADVRFVDVDPRTQLMDPPLLADAITPRTAAVVPVHLFGQIAPMEAIASVANARGVAVIEDGAQSQGATRSGNAMGRWGAACATSFYPGKNLGAYGDAGAVLTNDGDVAASLRALRNYGSEMKYEHPLVGFNSRLDTLQAVVLSAKLKLLDGWNEQRRRAAQRYDEMLRDVDGVVLPVVAEGNVHVWHLYVVRVPERDRVLAALHAAQIGAGIHYPRIVPLQGAFADGGYDENSFPVAHQASIEILTLPLYPGITDEQQERVATALRAAVGT
jgi:dTDP-4-amino-4,6-dideoxygalactose transaminase